MSVVPHAYGPAGSPRAPKILIVDDNPPTARALAALLGAASYHTTVALRGADALSLAEAAQADGPFDAAIVDLHLPDLSGLVVSQQLRQLLGPDVPIIVVSGDTSMPMLNSLSHVGANYFFSKPVSSSQLVERLRELVPTDGG